MILLVEFLIIKNSTLDPGAYEINTENYDKFIVLARSESNYYREVNQNEDEQTSMLGIRDDNQAPMLYIIPRFLKSGLFGVSDDEVAYAGNDGTRYLISDLRIQLRFTYSLNGVETTETVDVKIPKIESRIDSCVYLTVPVEAIEEATILGESIGSAMAKFDYWRVEITDISGFAEVKEEA